MSEDTAPRGSHPGPTQEEISARAYELYVARGCQDCGDLDDWLRAEAELRDASVPSAASGSQAGAGARGRVRRLLRSKEVLTVGADETCDRARQIMAWSGIRHLPVMRGKALVGVVSERDLLRDGQSARRLVSEIMSSPPRTIDVDSEIADAQWLMGTEKLGCLPVLSYGMLVGIVTATDLLQASSDG